jgi:hypothetical protein
LCNNAIDVSFGREWAALAGDIEIEFGKIALASG